MRKWDIIGVGIRERTPLVKKWLGSGWKPTPIVPPAWLSGWAYRSLITIEEQSGSNLENYQVLIELNSSNFNFEDVQLNGEDIRFTLDDYTTLIDYWMEEWDKTNKSAKIWAEVPSIPASGTKAIYMYYGNPSASSASNGANTFEFFDDFEFKSGTPGSHIGTTQGVRHIFASRIPQQRNSFYHNGRYWVFYSRYTDGGGQIAFKTSTNGINWSSYSDVASFNDYAADWTIWFDGIYVHYVRNVDASCGMTHCGLRYRRGTPNANGTITWSTAEQTIFDTTHAYGDMTLATDSDGYPWVAYGYECALGYANVVKSSKNDGIWSTADTFPYQLSDDKSTFGALVPLDNGKMYVVVYNYSTDSKKIKGQYWNGSSWTDEGEISVENARAGVLVTRVDAGGYYTGTVHIVYQDTNSNIKYRKRNIDGNWETEIALDDGTNVEIATSPVICIGDNNTLFVFWQDYRADKLFLKKYNGASWDDLVELLTDDFEEEYSHVMCYSKVGNNKIGLSYLGSNNHIWHVLVNATDGGLISAGVEKVAQDVGDVPNGWTTAADNDNCFGRITDELVKNGARAVKLYDNYGGGAVQLRKRGLSIGDNSALDFSLRVHYLSANEGGDNNDLLCIGAILSGDIICVHSDVYGDGPKWGYFDGSHHKISAFSLDQWYECSLRKLDFLNHQFDFYVDGSAIYTNASFFAAKSSGDTLLFWSGGSNHKGTAYLDNVRIRKYCSPEPLISL